MKTTSLHYIHEQLGATFAEKHQGWNIAAQFTDAVSEHHAVRNSVGIVDLSYRSRHQLTGDDRAKFLHRIISNDIEGLSAGQGTYATLLTHRGKIIADLNIYVLEDAIIIDAAPETAENLFGELDKYIIADDVELSDLTAETGAMAVHGPKSSELVQSVLGVSDVAALPERHNCVREVDERFKHPIVCVRTDTTGEVGYMLYTAAEALASLWEALMTEGSQFNVQPIGWNALESLRIEAGIPRYGTELTDAVIPLEAELEHAIDFEKGCYIGQEIVARMKYRGHPNRLLRGIEIDDSPTFEDGCELRPGARVFNGEKEVGWLTSTTFAPTLGKQVALGYVRIAVTEAGSRVQIETSNGQVDATVVLLPFST
ncbi:aminomethyl transferase family protein [Candidatus Poribacteria bacterium]|nr:aminomethyl transferase family protein [Candidatus Poribacteria bacterium]MYA98498.1 aminomethyl transferase family protein [Candidatus Poribacteria bacterium]